MCGKLAVFSEFVRGLSQTRPPPTTRDSAFGRAQQRQQHRPISLHRERLSDAAQGRRQLLVYLRWCDGFFTHQELLRPRP